MLRIGFLVALARREGHECPDCIGGTALEMRVAPGPHPKGICDYLGLLLVHGGMLENVYGVDCNFSNCCWLDYLHNGWFGCWFGNIRPKYWSHHDNNFLQVRLLVYNPPWWRFYLSPQFHLHWRGRKQPLINPIQELTTIGTYGSVACPG